MAYTQAQTLADTPTRHVTKRVNFANTESGAVFVNAASLNYALTTLTLVVNSSSYSPFKVGEVVNAAAGGQAVVQRIINTSTVVLHTSNGTFTAAQNVTGQTSNVVREQSGSLVPAAYGLHLSRLVYNVGGGVAGSEGKVQLEWEGTSGGANNRTIAVLSGSGVLELDSLGLRANNNANSATGNITLTCVQWSANSHYTLIADFSKAVGYAPPYLDQNQQLGY